MDCLTCRKKYIYPVIYGVVQGQEQCTEEGEDFGDALKDKALKYHDSEEY